MNTTQQVHVTKKEWSGGVEVFIRQRMDVSSWAYTTDVVLTTIKPEELSTIIPQGISFTPEAAQQLMDGLWDCGVRPTEGAGSAGAMRQAEEHLATFKKEHERLHGYLTTMIALLKEQKSGEGTTE